MINKAVCLLAVASAAAGCTAATTNVPAALRGAHLSFESLHVSSTAAAGPTPVPVAVASAGPAAEAKPANSGGQGGGGNGPSRGQQIHIGRVFGYDGYDAKAVPLEGATVWTVDGRSATTDDDGRFSLTGSWPEGGALTVTHPRYRASTVVGLPPGGEIALHLNTDAARPNAAPPSATHYFDVTGRVLGPDATPRGGVALSLTAPDGSFSGPTTSADDGSFVMRIFSQGDRVEDAAVVAVDEADPAIGAVSGLEVASGEAALDFDSHTGAAEPLTLAAADHKLHVDVAGGSGLTPHVQVELRLPGQGPLLIYGREDTVAVADLPGARYGVRVEAVSADQTQRSTFAREDVAIDFGRAITTLSAELLAPPVVTPLGGTIDAIAWQPVSGARGYEVRLDSLTKRSIQWQGFTEDTRLPFSLPGAAPAGPYTLTVRAWDAEGMAPRQVAALSRLRLLPPGGTYRLSSSEQSLAF